MAIDEDLLRSCWVKQVAENCGSCCVGSIANYIRYKQQERIKAFAASASMFLKGDMQRAPRLVQPPVLMDNTWNVGLTVDGVKGLGSVTAKLADWVEQTLGALCTVTQVKVQGLRHHWGVLNALKGGDSHRPTITPDANYFAAHPHRFLLRECSVGISGHFIIQTDADDFWDPNLDGMVPNSHGNRNPQTLGARQRWFSPWGLNLRADACQIDVA